MSGSGAPLGAALSLVVANLVGAAASAPPLAPANKIEASTFSSLHRVVSHRLIKFREREQRLIQSHYSVDSNFQRLADAASAPIG